MDEAGLILFKCDSVKQAKRIRDAFDVYFLLAPPKGTAIAARLKGLSATFPQVSQQLILLEAFLRDHANKFDDNVYAYMDHRVVIHHSPAQYVRVLLFA